MGKIMYRWYYKEDGKATISGVVLAETWGKAAEKTEEFGQGSEEDADNKKD